MAENTSGPNPPVAPPIAPVAKGDAVQEVKMNELITQLNNLLNHTHIFYDDYGTACNCNCNCNCTRGTL